MEAADRVSLAVTGLISQRATENEKGRRRKQRNKYLLRLGPWLTKRSPYSSRWWSTTRGNGASAIKRGPLFLSMIFRLSRGTMLSFFKSRPVSLFPLLKCDRNKRTYLHYLCPFWTFHLLPPSLAFLFFSFFFLLLLWMFLRRLTGRRLLGFLPAFFPLHPASWVSSGTTIPSTEQNTPLETKWDRQTGTVAEGDDDYNDVRLSVGDGGGGSDTSDNMSAALTHMPSGRGREDISLL